MGERLHDSLLDKSVSVDFMSDVNGARVAHPVSPAHSQVDVAAAAVASHGFIGLGVLEQAKMSRCRAMTLLSTNAVLGTFLGLIYLIIPLSLGHADDRIDPLLFSINQWILGVLALINAGITIVFALPFDLSRDWLPVMVVALFFSGSFALLQIVLLTRSGSALLLSILPVTLAKLTVLASAATWDIVHSWQSLRRKKVENVSTPLAQRPASPAAAGCLS